ncbi:MAG: OmpA family protein [Proteobacteria bacterium]|nr:OmpA family protein [Pseudomonadota bacterium]
MIQKKEKKQDPANDSMIQMLTISLFIILLAFFILLNSIAKVDEKKKRVAMGSLMESFGGEMTLQTKGIAPDAIFSDGVSPVDLSDLESGDVPGMKDITVSSSKRKTTLSIPDQMFFTGNGTRITNQGLLVLDKIIGILKTNEFPVDISGHTDDSPLEDPLGMNHREASTLKSVGVMEYLVEKGHIPAQRLTAFGWGKERPVGPNTNVRTRRMNRRIDITFIHDKSLDKPKGFFIFKDFFFNVKDQ